MAFAGQKHIYSTGESRMVGGPLAGEVSRQALHGECLGALDAGAIELPSAVFVRRSQTCHINHAGGGLVGVGIRALFQFVQGGHGVALRDPHKSSV